MGRQGGFHWTTERMLIHWRRLTPEPSIWWGWCIWCSLLITHSNMFQLSVSTLQEKAAATQIRYWGKGPGLFWGYRWELILTYGSIKSSLWDSGIVYRKQRKIEWQYQMWVFINQTFEQTLYVKHSSPRPPFVLHCLLWICISNWRTTTKNPNKLCVSDSLAQCKLHSLALRPMLAFVKPYGEGFWPWSSQMELELQWETQAEDSSPAAPVAQDPESWKPCRCPCNSTAFHSSLGTALRIEWVQGPSSAPLLLEDEHLSTVSWIPRAALTLDICKTTWSPSSLEQWLLQLLPPAQSREAVDNPPSGSKAEQPETWLCDCLSLWVF